jgi:hypothetical protein
VVHGAYQDARAMTFEPPATPTDNKPTKPRWRIVVIWVVLVLMFVSIYAMFTDAKAPPRAGHAAPPASSWSFDGLIPWMTIAAFVGLMLWLHRRSLRASREMGPGIIALHDGDYVQAETILGGVAARYQRTIGVGTVATYNLSLAQIARGDLAGAEASLARVESWPKLPYAASLRYLSAVAMARVCALRGDAGRARRWLEDARRRSTLALDGFLHRPLLLAAEILVLCREGRGREALEMYRQHEWALEGHSYRELRLVWAACALAASLDVGLREQAVADRWLRRLRPAGAGELAYAVGEWPELRAFLIAHELGAAVSASTDAAA